MTREKRKKEKEKLSELPPPFSFSFTYEFFPGPGAEDIKIMMEILFCCCVGDNRSADEMDLLDNRAPNAALSSAPLAVDTPLPPTTIKFVFISIEMCLYLITFLMDVVEHGVAVPDVSGSTPECQLVPAATTIRNDEQSTIGGKFKFFQIFKFFK